MINDRYPTHCDHIVNLLQELHGSRNTMFYLPGARISNWFEHPSSGQSISFWFRNKFPAIALCFAARSMLKESTITPNVIINGYIHFLDCRYAPSFWMEPDHTYIFYLHKVKFKANLDEELVENEWNHTEITYNGKDKNSILIDSGIHVFKQKSCMEDIRFTKPCIER